MDIHKQLMVFVIEGPREKSLFSLSPTPSPTFSPIPQRGRISQPDSSEIKINLVLF